MNHCFQSLTGSFFFFFFHLFPVRCPLLSFFPSLTFFSVSPLSSLLFSSVLSLSGLLLHFQGQDFFGGVHICCFYDGSYFSRRHPAAPRVPRFCNSKQIQIFRRFLFFFLWWVVDQVFQGACVQREREREREREVEQGVCSEHRQETHMIQLFFMWPQHRGRCLQIQIHFSHSSSIQTPGRAQNRRAAPLWKDDARWFTLLSRGEGSFLLISKRFV